MNKNKPRTLWRLIAALLAAVALLAAAGLGSAGVLAPPAVVDLQPDPEAHTAPVDASVSITYDQDMDPASVNPQSFAVHARQTGWLTQTLSVTGGTITLDPPNDFHAGELVQASATTNLLSLGREAPLKPTVWQFTTAPWGGNAAFHERQVLVNTSSRDTALGDLDGDNDLDALTVSCGGCTRIYHNDGSGIFSEVQSFVHLDYCLLDANLGDLDGEGDLDAVLVNYSSITENLVLLNNGDGTFTDSGQVLNSTLDTYGELGDLDLFVASGGYLSGTLRVWQNDSAGAFTLKSNFDSAYSHTGVALGDLDGDYDLDAFTTGWNNTYNKVWLNDGAGDFSEIQAIPNANTYSAQLGDLDSDGDLDAYFANYRSDNTNPPDEVWLNDGTGAFTNSGQSLMSVAAVIPALGDLDGDGNLDAFVASDISLVGYQVYLNGDWTQAEPVPHITTLAATIHCPDDPNGFYMLGGYDAVGSILNHFRHYDATTNQWMSLAPFPYPVSTPAAACHASKIYAAISWDLYIYNIATNTWTKGPPPPRMIEAAGSSVWNGSLYIIGGYNYFGGVDGRKSDPICIRWAAKKATQSVLPTPIATTCQPTPGNVVPTLPRRDGLSVW